MSFEASHAQWHQVYDENSGDIESLAADAHFIYAGTDSGVFRSSDEGGTWLQVNNGLLEDEVYSLGISKAGNLFGGTEGHGIFRTTNSGDQWTERDIGLPDSSTIFAIVGDKFGNLFAGSATDGVFYSSNEGDSWNYRSQSLTNKFVWSMIITPSNELVVGLSGQIVRSSDSGMHWTRLDSLASNNEVLSLACDSFSVLYAGTLRGDVLRSEDSGKTWQVAATSPTHKPVRNIAIRDSMIYAATYGDGVLESSDRGLHFRSANEGLTDTLLYRITISPKGYVYLGTFTAKVFRSLAPLAVVTAETQAKRLSAYPNPATNQIEFIAPDLGAASIEDVKIYDCLGRLRMTKVGSGPLDLHAIANGFYFARIETLGVHANMPSTTSLRFIVSH